MQPRTADIEFRRALAQFATGVTIVTTRSPEGVPVGLTVNSFNSVSLDPPLILWSLARKAASLPAFRASARYAVNMLAADQLDTAKRFATRGAERFGAIPWAAGTDDVPIIDGCVAWLIASNRSQYDEGDHVILVGEVIEFGAPGGEPLIFHDGRYIASATEEPLPRELQTPWR
jgi:flavin reductase (DIM6/NTAB) family NADH-FMN oxidoreductase RutF